MIVKQSTGDLILDKLIQQDIIHNQINHLIELGYPKLLKLTIQEYLNSFSQIGEPTFFEYKNRFDLPVVVDPRVPFIELISKVNINNNLHRCSLKLSMNPSTSFY